MLAPSPFPCNSQQPPRTLLPPFSPTYHSPPATPPTISAQRALSNIMNSCRTLQSLVTNVPSSSNDSPLLTPPLTHAPPPLKLRLRSSGRKPTRREPYPSSSAVRKPTRSPAKKRRFHISSTEHTHGADMQDTDSEDELQRPADNEPVAPSTPKRAHIAPERLPLGLERSDFHDLHEPMHHNQEGCENAESGFSEEEMYHNGNYESNVADSDMWSADDDRILVELILEKLKLSKAEWQDCARHLGRDSDAVNRRWKSLMLNGDVGLKRHAARRTGLHSTWR